MTAPIVDRILVEASPGETRAVTFAGDEAWDILIERGGGDAAETGDVYLARAGGTGPDGGRFFDLGPGGTGHARRVHARWHEGAMGLVQVARPAAGGKGPRVSERIEITDGGLAVWAPAGGALDDRIEVARTLPKGPRAAARKTLGAHLPAGFGVRLEEQADDGLAERLEKLLVRFRDMQRASGGAHRVFAADREVRQAIQAWPNAVLVPADLATAAWLREAGADHVERPESKAAADIDDVVSACRILAVELPGGGRIWVEPTRALVAVDVDQAGAAMPPQDLNREAAREIARQLRLRRLGGLVAVDFLRGGADAGVATLAGYAKADPWPWAAPTAPGPSGLVVFERPRRAASLRELTLGPAATALHALRRAVRATADGRTPAAIRTGGEAVAALRGDLAAALEAAETRIGARLDLRVAEGLGFAEIMDRNGRVLDRT